MSTEGMIDVEVPARGVVIVEDGNVYSIDSDKDDFVLCTCHDGLHSQYARTHRVDRTRPPHVVGLKTVTMTWEPTPNKRLGR